MRRFRHRPHAADAGVTLVELVVGMVILALIMGVISAAMVQMLHQQQRQNGIADDLDGSRKIVQLLDRQVRYANAISAPGTASDGNTYVEWRTGNSGQQQTCTQWRYVPTTFVLESRSWLPPLAGVAVPTPTAWATVAVNIKPVGANPIWSLTPASTDSSREALTMQFLANNGHPATSSSSQVSITAINSSSSTAPASVCTEVARS